MQIKRTEFELACNYVGNRKSISAMEIMAKSPLHISTVYICYDNEGPWNVSHTLVRGRDGYFRQPAPHSPSPEHLLQRVRRATTPDFGPSDTRPGNKPAPECPVWHIRQHAPWRCTAKRLFNCEKRRAEALF